MNRGTAIILLLAAGSLLSAASKDLSADMVVLQGGATVDTMKIYLSGQMTRTEMTGMGTVGIARRDRRVVWVLYPSRKEYMEKPLDATSAVQDPGVDPPGVVKKERIGSDNVSGYPCTRFRLTIAPPGGRQTTAVSCVADALGVAVRMEVAGLVTELRNIRPGPQPGHLFEVPAGYRKSASQVPPNVQLPANLPPGMAEKMRQAIAQGGAAGGGASAARSGTGAAGTLPSWLPPMPGCAPRVSGNEQSGGVGMICGGGTEEVTAWYEAALRKNGFEVKLTSAPVKNRSRFFNMRALRAGLEVVGNVSVNQRGETAVSFTWLPRR